MFTPNQQLRRVFLAALLLCNAGAVAADVVVHELVFADNTSFKIDPEQSLAPITLQFSAMGRDTVLQLVPSRFNRLVNQHNNPSAQPRLYQGHVEGDANSWARVSLYDGKISGSLFYANTLLQLESQAYLLELSNSNSNNNNNNNNNNNYVLIEPTTNKQANSLIRRFFSGNDVLGFAPPNPLFNKSTHANSVEQRIVTASANGLGTAVTRAMRIGIVIDSRFNEVHNNRGLARALSIINSVDAIYQSQLGIALIVEGIRVYDDPATDPMRNLGGSVNKTLANFRQFRVQDERLPSDLTLVHLFSGHRDPDRVIGLGWVGAACRLDGFDLSMSTPFPFDTLLAAHEIAHNLGALHDDAPQCNAEVNKQQNTLMWPELSGSSSATFSDCSILAIQTAKNASCNLENIDVSIALRIYPSSEALRRSVIVEVANKDTLGRATEMVSKTRFPDGTRFGDLSAGCNIDGSTIICTHGRVQPGTAQSIAITATLLSRSQENVISEVNLLNATDTRSNDNRTVIQLLQFDQVTGEAIAAISAPAQFDDVLTTPNDFVTSVGSVQRASLASLLLLMFYRLRRTAQGAIKHGV